MAPFDLELRYPDGHRERVRLGRKPLNQGADGAIYAVPRKKLALKLYHDPAKDPERLEKIRQMLLVPPDDKGLQHFAWPVAQLFNPQGGFVGYAMPLLPVSNYVSLDLLLTRKGRQLGKLPESRDFRVKAASNLAQRVAQLHAKGHCIIDIKPANLLVHRKTAEVTVVDCDGFGIQGENGFIPGHQFTTGYIAPEAWNSKLKPEALDKEQDLFALAVIIFQLLNEGLHPYQGIPAGKRAIPGDTQNRIGAGLYPYGVIPDARIKPSPWSLHRDFPPGLKRPFDQVFAKRPKRLSANGWVHLLGELSEDLKTCKKNQQHVYWGSHCPICKQSTVTIEVKKPRTKKQAKPKANPRPIVRPYQNSPTRNQRGQSPNGGSALFKGVSIVFAIMLGIGYVYHLLEEDKRSRYYAEQWEKKQQEDAERERQRVKALEAEKALYPWRDTGEPATATTVYNQVHTLPPPLGTRDVTVAESRRQVPYFQPGAFTTNNAVPLLMYSPVRIAWEYTAKRPVSRVNLDFRSDKLAKNGSPYALKELGGYQLRDWYVHPDSDALYLRKCGFQMNCYQLARITPDGKETVFRIEAEPKNDGSGHRHKLVDPWYFAVTGDERYIIVAGHGRLLVYRPDQPERPLAEVEYPLSYRRHEVSDLAITPGGERIYVGMTLTIANQLQLHGSVLEYSLNDHGQAEFRHDFIVGWPDDGSLNAGTVDVSDDGKTLALGTYHGLKTNDAVHTRNGKALNANTAKPGVSIWQEKEAEGGWSKTGEYVLGRKVVRISPPRPGVLPDNMGVESLPKRYGFNIGFDLTGDGSRLLSGMELEEALYDGLVARAWVLDVDDGAPKMRARLQRGYTKTKAYPTTAVSSDGKDAFIGWAYFHDKKLYSSMEDQLHLVLTAFDLSE
ncbi:hypothetical protein [uncultured Marinobacter sp.]|uniref:protein kinase domain-containing protein n=1 Tax=uncultured Marinobacter sp. TaxID=187379 RepID=UPI0026335D8D|nr:hypothetical protein [uncultured Marinobacter sp.]